MEKKEKRMTDYEKHLVEKDGDYRIKGTRFFNVFARLVALLIAFGIWVYAKENDTVIGDISFSGIPVKIVNTSDTPLSVISGYNSTVDVVLEGKKGTVRSITADDIEIVADVSDITSAGRHTVPIDISAPEGATVVSQSLSSVSVYMDKTISITVPVQVRYSAYMLDDGYELGDAVPSISQITVSGPENILKDVYAAETSLDLGHITGSVVMTGDLVLIDADGSEISNPYVKLQTGAVQVSVPLQTVKTLPLTVDFKYGYINETNSSVTVTPAEIEVKGEVSVLEGLEKLSVATIDEKHLSGDTFVQPIVLPDGVSKVSDADTATVRISHIGTALKSIVITDFDVHNPNALNYEIQNSSLTVTLRGPVSALAEITGETVTASIELNFDKSVNGISTVPVKISISGASSEVYEVGDYTVSVRLRP